MASSGMLRRVALVRTDVSEYLSVSFIRVTRIGEIGTSVLTTATRRNIPENAILLVTAVKNTNLI
jgi:ABC-type taurine transport system substrate-binding protein